VVPCGGTEKGRFFMSTAQERSERGRTAAFTMWAKINQRLQDNEAAQERLNAAETARRRLALLKAQRVAEEARQSVELAAARLAEVQS